MSTTLLKYLAGITEEFVDEVEIDFSKVTLDDVYIDKEYGEVTYYFMAPKELTSDIYPDAVSSEISIAFPIGHDELSCAYVMMSPTRDEGDALVDYDWSDVSISETEFDKFMKIAGVGSQKQ